MDAIIPPHPTPANNVAQRRAASVLEHSINVASTSSASVHGRYYPTPPHPTRANNVAQRRAASVLEHSINVASSSSASVHGRYYPTPPHPTPPIIYFPCAVATKIATPTRL